MRSRYRIWIGVLISIVCFALALRSAPITEIINAVRRAKLLWLFLAVVVQVLAVLPRAERWLVLLEHRPRRGDMFWGQSIGYLFNNILPFRAGEIARTVVVAQRGKMPLFHVGASVLAERLLDTMTVVLLLGLILPLVGGSVVLIGSGTLLGIISVIGLTVIVLAARFPAAGDRLICLLPAKLGFLTRDRIQGFWAEIMSGLRPLKDLRFVLKTFGWSIISWAVSIGMYWCVLFSFHSDASLIEATFLVVALSLSATVPSSPGYVGVFQFVGQQALVLPFGGKYDPSTALAIVLAAHLVYLVVPSLLGIVGLWRVGLTLGGVKRAVNAKMKNRACG